jgi:hypothetical protein
MVAESNDYQKEVVNNDSTRRLQEFKQHFEKSSLEEKIRIAQFWD